MANSELGQRGKYAERETQKVLDRLNRLLLDFDYTRVADARAARGRLAAQVGDFEWFRPAYHGVIEVKTVQHDYRLPVAKLPQLPRLKKRALAGGKILVLVYHTTTKRWRPCPLAAFKGEMSSWNLSDYETFDTAEEAMLSTGWFCQYSES